MPSKTRMYTSQLPGLSSRGTYRIDPELALELEVYAKVGKHGAKKNIIEDSLTAYFKKHPIDPKLRAAALVLLEDGGK